MLSLSEESGGANAKTRMSDARGAKCQDFVFILVQLPIHKKTCRVREENVVSLNYKLVVKLAIGTHRHENTARNNDEHRRDDRPIRLSTP